MHDVICLGDMISDTFLLLDEAEILKQEHVRNKHYLICFDFGDKIPIKKQLKFSGGSAANVAVGLARLGLKSAIATTASKTADDQKIIQTLHQEKVNIELTNQGEHFEPHYSYMEKYKLDRGVTEVTAEMCDRIRKEEGAEGITPYFAARVFALIYNLKLRAVPYGGEVVYFLVPREAEGRNIMQTPESEVDKKSFKRLFEKMGKDIEAMENLWDSEDYMKVLDYMMRRGKKKQL